MQDTPAPRTCSVDGCEAPLRATNTIGRCREHAYIPAAGAVCSADGCDTLLRKDNQTGYCTPHKRANSRGDVPKRDFTGRVYPDRTCPDCGNVFTPASANHERCPDCQHAHRLALRAEREGRNDRDTCSVDGCDAKLRCHEHRAPWREEYNRDYYERNQAALREYARQYREVYVEEHRAAAVAWAAANPEARQAMHARRRQRVAADMDDTDRLLSALYRAAIRNDPCFYCGSPATDHVDHFFPLSKGGTDHWFNLVRACERDNLSKNAQCGTAYLLRRGRL